MPFDAGPDPAPYHAPSEPLHEPIDWLDWGMRIAVFAPLLVLYLYWIWAIILTAVRAFS